MILCSDFFELLKRNEFTFFSGVPDSLLKHICAYITDNVSSQSHVIAANEGNAVAIAAGYYLSTGRLPVVYLQNSGLGNTVNPLTSLADREVYSIPMLLLIGWRGSPGTKDEPQHMKMGRIQSGLLDAIEIPSATLPTSLNQAKKTVEKARKALLKTSAPYALVVRKGTFKPYRLQKKRKLPRFELTREKAVEIVTSHVGTSDIIVSTTGKTSRELFELREKRKEEHARDFLCVGNMGHASSIALGIALQKKRRKVWCFDGDGAFIMHMGAIAVIGQTRPKNFYHVIFNNYAHDSVGGQPTASDVIDMPRIAENASYQYVKTVRTRKQLENALRIIDKKQGPVLLEIKCKKGARADLGRPTRTPRENKKDFMKFLE